MFAIDELKVIAHFIRLTLYKNKFGAKSYDLSHELNVLNWIMKDSLNTNIS